MSQAGKADRGPRLPVLVVPTSSLQPYDENLAPWAEYTEAVWGVREEFHSVVGSWIFAPIIG